MKPSVAGNFYERIVADRVLLAELARISDIDVMTMRIRALAEEWGVGIDEPTLRKTLDEIRRCQMGDEELEKVAGGSVRFNEYWGDQNSNNLNDILVGSDSADLIYGGGGDDKIEGGAGNDTVMGSRGNDLIFGGDGDDFILGGSGDDTLVGGAGNDTLVGDNRGGATAFVFSGTGSDTDTVESFDPSTDRIILEGVSSADGFSVSHTTDKYTRYIGPDFNGPGFRPDVRPECYVEVVEPHTVITFGESAIIVRGVHLSVEEILAMQGNFSLDDGQSDEPVPDPTVGQHFEGTWKADFLTGTDGDDTFNTQTGDDRIHAGAGNDLIYAGGGDDIVVGGDGNDTIYTSHGDDIIDGGSGDDVIHIEGGGNKDVIGGEGSDMFVLSPHSPGRSTIRDFGDGDVIKLDGFSPQHQFAVFSHNNTTTIMYGRSVVIVEGVTLTQEQVLAMQG